LNFITAAIVPFACVLLSIFLKVVLAVMLDPAPLKGATPPVLDVSIQLILISMGGVLTGRLSKDQALKNKLFWPAVGCFVGLIVTLTLLAVSKLPWDFISAYQSWFRVWGPNLVGAATIGITIGSVRRRQLPKVA